MATSAELALRTRCEASQHGLWDESAEKDRRNIKLAIEQDIDFIAHSFVRNAGDVKAVQDVLDEYGSDIKIISKIENQEGVDNIDEIIEASYGIMIARGDLGNKLLSTSTFIEGREMLI